ncbi:A disintegrin and metalloproteinase with thrombospondin motifs 5, partial [Biomphalaria pfeifferi]
MELDLFILICGCFFVCIFNGVQSSTVHVNFSSTDLNDKKLPDDISVTIAIGANTSTELQLSRVEHINSTIPVYTLDSDQDGLHMRRENINDDENVAFYQDLDNDAIIQLALTIGSENHSHKFKIQRGEFQQDDVRYSIKPSTRSKRENSQSDDSYEVTPVVTPVRATDFGFLTPDNISSTLMKEYDLDLEDLHGDRLKRSKRQSMSTYYIDVSAFVDFNRYAISLRLKSDEEILKVIQQYYAFIFTGIDLIYQNFPAENLQLRVRLSKVVVFKNASILPLTTKSQLVLSSLAAKETLDADNALKVFSNFLSTTTGRDLSFPYDHAMLFVGVDLVLMLGGIVRTATDITGYAYIATLCKTDGTSVSIVEDFADFTCIVTAAHELGHSLSAKHDGEENTCPWTDRYLMAPTSSWSTEATSQNPWRFSNCTVDYIVTFVTKIADTVDGQTCLSDTLPVHGDFPDVSQELLGQIYPVAEQCRLRYGGGSFNCLELYVKTSDICTKLFCYKPEYTEKRFCYAQPALTGTSCGCGKICWQGACINDTISKVKDCLVDDLWSNCTYKSCEDAELRRYCPYTCKDYVVITTTTTKTTDEYGIYDYAPDCNISDCLIPERKKNCYKTCASKDPTCQNQATFSYMRYTCQSVMLASENICYFPEVQRACCMSCSLKATNIT